MPSRTLKVPSRTLKVPYAREIEGYVQAAVKDLRACSVVLYGSLARGDYNEASDIDIVVIADNLPKDFLKRLKLLQHLNRSREPIEALGFTREEFARMLERRHPTALYAVADGKVLFDDGFFVRMRRRFRRLSEEVGLERIESGWIAHKIFDENIKRLTKRSKVFEPLHTLVGRASRAKPLRDIGKVAEEELDS